MQGTEKPDRGLLDALGLCGVLVRVPPPVDRSPRLGGSLWVPKTWATT